WPESRSTGPLNDVFLAGTAALDLALAGLLASRVPLSVRWLRAGEVALFGMAALFFARLQLTLDMQRRALAWSNTAHFQDVQRLANAQNSLRWFILIVTYGTFVPNTWRRCAAVVALLTLTPLALTMASPLLLGCPHLMSCLGQSLVDSIIVLSMGSAIAIF